MDSALFGPLFGDSEMARIWSEERQIETWLEFEAALARAEASCGLIPEAAARAITAAARLENIDLHRLAQEMKETSHVMVPFVRQLAAACEGDHGEYVHWGATTQDVMDTGLVLQVRDTLERIEGLLDRTIEVLRSLAVRHRSTMMAGRTHAQHAVPITFGFKVAIWVDELKRHRARLDHLRADLLVGQLGGAAGTLSSLGVAGLPVREAMMQDLGLGVPDITWHAARDRFAHFAFVMAGIGATMRRAAQEVINLQRPEIGEVAERFESGKVGSSTMPHKQNPAIAQIICTLGIFLQDGLSLAMQGLVQNHERDMSVLQTEWQWLPQMSVHLSRSLRASIDLFSTLVVDPERMARNLELTSGLIFSESVMMNLAEVVGRQTAHDVVYEAALRVHQNSSTLAEEVLKDEHLRARGIDVEARGVLDSRGSIEVAELFVDAVCGTEPA